MTTYAGAGVERHKAERLGLRRFNHLPDVNPHSSAEQRQFVDERDVDRAEDVFEEFRHLRRAG